MILRTNTSQIDYVDGFAAIRHRKAQRGWSASSRRSRRQSIIAWALVIVLACLFFWLFSVTDAQRGRVRPPSRPPRDYTWLVPVGVSLGSYVASLVLAVWLTRRAIRAQLATERPTPIEITADGEGICCDSTRGRMLYRWSLFRCYAESAKSFALEARRINMAEFLVVVIPKSAFATRQETEEFRQLLRENVLPEASRVTRATAAFPVVPVGAGQQEPEMAGGDAPMEREVAIPAGTLVGNAQYEYDDLAVALTGWQRPAQWRQSVWWAAVWGVLIDGVIISGTAAVMAALHSPVFWFLLAVPAVSVWMMGRAVVARRSHAGRKAVWTQHVLSYGPASVWLEPEGIVLKSVHHEMLFRAGSVIAAIESDQAFSIIDRQWEIIIPKRLLAGDAVAGVRDGLQAQFGPLTVVPKGKAICVRPRADGTRQR